MSIAEGRSIVQGALVIESSQAYTFFMSSFFGKEKPEERVCEVYRRGVQVIIRGTQDYIEEVLRKLFPQDGKRANRSKFNKAKGQPRGRGRYKRMENGWFEDPFRNGGGS